MSSLAGSVEGLFCAPGSRDDTSCGLLDQAALAHSELIERAFEWQHARGDPSLAILHDYLHGPANSLEKRQLLCDPILIESLHGHAACNSVIDCWHRALAPPRAVPSPDDVPALAHASLGNVQFSLVLRAEPQWVGEMELRTDLLGRICFPFSDWSISLRQRIGDQLAACGCDVVHLSLKKRWAVWRCSDPAAEPFLIQPRDDCLRFLRTGGADWDISNWEFPNRLVRPRIQCACPLCATSLRYDAVGFQSEDDHAGITGGVIANIVEAIRLNSPGIFGELCRYEHTIRGYEFPESSLGVIGSFSDPEQPGVMSVNIPYSAGNEPRISPFCFTWLGHELGHTKDYLIDDVLFGRGERLLTNGSEDVGLIPRYGRSLCMRTVIQIPYVHLYELKLLIDFMHENFRGLAWHTDENPIPHGEEICSEISDSFELISARAQLTDLGKAAVRHLRNLYASLTSQWLQLRPAA